MNIKGLGVDVQTKKTVVVPRGGRQRNEHGGG
jgi:hypothetical protein